MTPNPFHEVRSVLAGEAAATQRHIRDIYRKADWDIPEEVNAYRAAKRIATRNHLLDTLVPDRVCPDCDTLKPNRRAWVVNRTRSAATCRSCFLRHTPDLTVTEVNDLTTTLFHDPVLRYPVDGEALIEIRESLGLSRRAAARQMNVSATYLLKLESGDVKSISPEAGRHLEQTFINLGAKFRARLAEPNQI